jgi:hypothetical protein
MLALFFSGLVVSWIATVFVMDGSLKNFHAEKEQIEAERKGKQFGCGRGPSSSDDIWRQHCAAANASGGKQLPPTEFEAEFFVKSN